MDSILIIGNLLPHMSTRQPLSRLQIPKHVARGRLDNVVHSAFSTESYLPSPCSLFMYISILVSFSKPFKIQILISNQVLLSHSKRPVTVILFGDRLRHLSLAETEDDHQTQISFSPAAFVGNLFLGYDGVVM